MSGLGNEIVGISQELQSYRHRVDQKILTLVGNINGLNEQY